MKTLPQKLFSSLVLLVSSGLFAATNSPEAYDKQQINDVLKNIPVSFRKNLGQWENEILFKGSSPGWNADVAFLKTGLSFGFSKSAEINIDNGFGLSEEDEYDHMVWNMLYKNANQNCEVNSFGEQQSNTNYLYSADPTKNQLNVPDYRMLEYKNLYNNIDAKYYWNNNNLEYDYILHPGSNVNSIEIFCEGIKGLSIENKNLMIATEWGTLQEHMPESYQIINGVKKSIHVIYRLINNNTFGFEIVDKYDKNLPLVIDPVTLDWSTFVSGIANTESGYLYDIDVDANGNVYATGGHSAGLPTTAGVYSNTYYGGTTSGSLYNTLKGADVFIVKFDPTGSTLLLSTYVGGSMDDVGRSIRINNNGEIYVVGATSSFVSTSPFPTTATSYNPYTNTIRGYCDAFLIKLNSSATTLLYSTMLGGADEDRAEDLDIDASGDAYICGFTQSLNISGAANAFLGGNRDAFVCKISPQGSGANDLKYFRYVGGNNTDVGHGIKVNNNKEAYITGSTKSNNLTTSAIRVSGALNGAWDAFVYGVNAGGTSVLYSTYLGGSNTFAGSTTSLTTNPEAGIDIYLTATNNIIIAGQTVSTDFPTTLGAFDNTFNATTTTFDIFITHIDPTINGVGGIKYSTYIGGSNNDYGPQLAVNAQEEVFVVCHVFNSNNMPIGNCYYDNAISGMEDIYFAKLNSSLSQLLYSTYIGMGGNDYFPSIDLHGSCEEYVYIGATTHSLNFPTTAGAYQNGSRPNSNGNYDEGAILRFKSAPLTGFTYDIHYTACQFPVVSFTDTTNKGSCSMLYQNWAPSNWFWDFGDGTTSTLQHPTHTYSATGNYNVKLRISCPLDSVIIPLSIVAPQLPTAFIPSQNDLACYGDNNGSAFGSAIGGAPAYQYQWSTNPIQTTNTATGLSAGTYTLIVTDVNGCTATRTVNIIQPTQLVVNGIVSTSILCNGGNNGVLSANANGGTPGYTYSWSNGNTGTTVSSIAAGTYSITVTDQYSCSTTSTIIITEPSAVGVNIITTDALCNGSATGITNANGTGGASGYNYVWSNSANGNTATGLISGIYSVTVTDANGCVGTGTTTINQPTALTLSLSSTDAHCGQSDGSATVVANGGTTGYNYVWNNGSISDINNNIPFGVYTVTVTDANGCSANQSISVGNLNGVVASIASSTPTLCNASCDGSATASPLGGNGPYVYSWNTGGATITEGGLCAGIFSVTITDADGCKDVTSVIITQPAAISATLQATATSCFGGNDGSITVTSTSGGTSPYNYSWQTGTAGAVVTNLSIGNYSVTIIDDNGCTGIFSTSVTEPTQLIANTQDASGCPGTSTTLTANAYGATPGYTYNWSNGLVGSSVIFMPTNSALYTVTVTDANGCTAIAQSSVTVYELPIINFTADITSGCGPLCVNLNSGNNPSIVQCQWNFGDNSASNTCGNVNHCFTTPGSYNITLTSTDVNGCSNTLTQNNYITVHPDPIAAFTPVPRETSILNPTINFIDESINATTWKWNLGDVVNNISNDQNTSYTYPDTGWYEVTLEVTNEFGCKANATDRVRILPDVAFYTPNSFTPNGDTKNDVFIPMAIGIEDGSYSFLIYDRWGNLIFKTNNPTTGWDGIVMGESTVAQQDTYVWKVGFKNILGQQKRITGHVNLIK